MRILHDATTIATAIGWDDRFRLGLFQSLFHIVQGIVMRRAGSRGSACLRLRRFCGGSRWGHSGNRTGWGNQSRLRCQVAERMAGRWRRLIAWIQCRSSRRLDGRKSFQHDRLEARLRVWRSPAQRLAVQSIIDRCIISRCIVSNWRS